MNSPMEIYILVQWLKRIELYFQISPVRSKEIFLSITSEYFSCWKQANDGCYSSWSTSSWIASHHFWWKIQFNYLDAIFFETQSTLSDVLAKAGMSRARWFRQLWWWNDPCQWKSTRMKSLVLSPICSKKKERTILVFHLTNGVLIQCDILSRSIFFPSFLDQVNDMTIFSFSLSLCLSYRYRARKISTFNLRFVWSRCVRKYFFIDNDTRDKMQQAVRLKLEMRSFSIWHNAHSVCNRSFLAVVLCVCMSVKRREEYHSHLVNSQSMSHNSNQTSPCFHLKRFFSLFTRSDFLDELLNEIHTTDKEEEMLLFTIARVWNEKYVMVCLFCK